MSDMVNPLDGDVRTPLSERGGGPDTPGSDRSRMKLRSIATFLSVNESVLLPLPEEVVNRIYAKANELDALQSRQLVERINWEQSLHTLEEKVEVIQKRFRQASQDKEALEQSLTKLQDEKTALHQQMLTLQGSNMTDEGLVKIMESQMESLKAEKTRLLDFLERRKTEVNEYRAELDVSQAKLLEARKTIVQVETQADTLRSEHLNGKLRQQSLAQELESLKKTNAWLDEELKARSNEFQKFRSSSLERTSSLQVKVSELSSEQESLTRAHNQLKERYNDTLSKFESASLKVKDLESSRAIAEEGFRNEMASQQKLCELWEKSAKENRTRVEDLEEQLKRTQLSESEELTRWKLKAEKETVRADKLAEKLTRLDQQLESNLLPEKSGFSGPSTPQKGAGSNVGYLSPSAEVIGKLQKRGISLVQLYSDYQETKMQLEREKIKNSSLRDEMDQIVAEMDSHAPEFLNERMENERMQLSLADMSSQLESSQHKVEELTTKLNLSESKLLDGRRERDLLTKQSRDLTRQVRSLLIRFTNSDISALSVEEKQNLEVLLRRADLNENSQNEETDSDLLISERLVEFNDIIELQRHNKHLLNLARKLTMEREEEEQRNQELMSDVEREAVNDAVDAINTLQEQLEKAQVRLDALQKERDMFKEMLRSRKSLDSGDRPNGSSQHESTHFDQQCNESAMELSQLRANFEAYKVESISASNELNKELRVIRDQRSELQVKLSRTEGQHELTIERLENAKRNVASLQRDNLELRERSKGLQEALARQEVRTQQAAAELVEARSLLESAKTESANLKAERSLWKSVESRLTKENSDLLQDKGRLNGLLSSVTVTQDERETAFRSSEQMLKQRISQLTDDVKKLERSLEGERENLTKLNSRREAEMQQSLERVTTLNNDLSSSHSTVAQLKYKITQLESEQRELHSHASALQEKVTLYEQSERGESIKKQADQLANLQAKLAAKEEELRQAMEQVDTVTELARVAEDALQAMTQTHDEFKLEMEQRVVEKEELTELQKKLHDTEDSYAKIQLEFSNSQQTHANDVRALVEENEIALSRLKNVEEAESRMDEMQKSWKTELDQQSVLVRDAQQNYENELLKHAEAATALKDARAKLSTVQEEIAFHEAQARSAKDKLASSEASWDSQKYTYEHEIEQLKNRINDLSAQNDNLLDQLERANNRLPVEGISEEQSVGSEDQSSTSARLVAYLRQEKAIAVTNQTLAQQEAARLKQQLDHTMASLDEAKLMIMKEQQRESEMSSVNSELEDMKTKLHELNLLRESNDTLRSQSDYYMKKAESLEAELTNAKESLVPLEDQLRDAKSESQAKTKEIELLRQDNDKWKQRSQRALESTNSVDPEELKALHEQVETLTLQVSKLETERDAKISELQSRNDMFNKLKQESQAKLKRRRDEHMQERDSLNKVIEGLNADLVKVKSELESVQQASLSGKAQNDEIVARLTDELAAVKRDLEAKKNELASNAATLSKDSVAGVDQEQFNEKQAIIEASQKQIEELQVKISSLEQRSQDSDVAALTQAKDDLTRRVAELTQQVESLRAMTKDEFGRPIDIEQAKKNWYQQWNRENLAKLTEQAKTQLEERKLALEKEYNEKIAANSQRTGDSANLEQQIKEAMQKGREAATKELNMRTKLIQGKLDKIAKEKQSLQEQLAQAQGGAIIGASNENKPDASTGASPAGNALGFKGRGGVSNRPGGLSTTQQPAKNGSQNTNAFQQRLGKPVLQRPKLLKPDAADEASASKRPSMDSSGNQAAKKRKESEK